MGTAFPDAFENASAWLPVLFGAGKPLKIFSLILLI